MNEPVDPQNADSSTSKERSAPETWKEWLASNAMLLTFLIGAVAWIIWKELDPIVIMKVVVALGLVIFIHELGHFLAAKWCDVHVETFSIGFGKPIPGCRFKYGETTYKIGWIPLGGYVKMIGEGDNADTEEAEEDPRSFKNKRVGQRMLIISAGVVMNILLAGICFIVAYSHGVDDTAPIDGWVESGSPAWQNGMRSGAILDQIDGITQRPAFDDVRPEVRSTRKDESVRFLYRASPDGPEIEVFIVPSRDDGALYPTIGIGPASQLTVQSSKHKKFKPFREGSPAASANPPFQGGDKIVACSSDPADYTKVTPLPPDQRGGGAGRLDFFEFYRRMVQMRSKPMIIEVKRGEETIRITVGSGFYATAGLRMQMARIAAQRKDSPAALAKVIEIDGQPAPPDEEKGFQPSKSDARDSTGDKVIAVTAEANGKLIRWTSEKGDPPASMRKREIENRPLDPLHLPYDLEKWADAGPANPTVTIEIDRPTAPKEQKKEFKRVVLEMQWDPTAKYSIELITSPNSPLSIPGLGLAYHVAPVVDAVAAGSPAADADFQKDDQIKEVRWKYLGENGKVEESKWQPIKSYQWAYVFNELQAHNPKEIDVKVERAGVEGLKELKLSTTPDPDWPVIERGLNLMVDTRLQKADDLGEALAMGGHRTLRTVRMIYQNLYAIIFGRVSVMSLSGPLKIANVSYNIAVDDLWQFILFIGMINVNLAVINFLPIPVLDGGHMVFLIYEKIRGKPAPEAVLTWALYAGLAMILSLMCFVIYLDLQSLIF
jgi:regulator of sigma E protease